MLVNPLPLIVMAFKFSQLENASSGIAVTVAGIVTRTARVLFLNTPAPNAVTGFPPKVSGMTSAVVSNETAETVAATLLVVYVHTLPEPSVHVSAHAQLAANAASNTTISLFIVRLLSPDFVVIEFGAGEQHLFRRSECRTY